MLSKAVMHKINKLAKAIQPACGDYHVALHFAFKYCYEKHNGKNFLLWKAIYELTGFCGMPYWFAEENNLYKVMSGFKAYEKAAETKKAVLLTISYRTMAYKEDSWVEQEATTYEREVWVPKSILMNN